MTSILEHDGPVLGSSGVEDELGDRLTFVLDVCKPSIRVKVMRAAR